MNAASEPMMSDQPAVQDEAVASAGIISFVVALLIGLGILTLVASYWFHREAQVVNNRHAIEASYPNLERLNADGMQQLNRYEMLDAGIYRIPVEQAMLRLSDEFPQDASISEEMAP